MADTTWRDQLQPASFRGVPFFVDSDSQSVGRRTQVHEYPQRDKPFVEDLGRKTRIPKLAAFVVGDDCFVKRDDLLKALDQPGPGELIHPWFGRMTVTATDCDVSHERREGGVVRFDLTFVEDGEKGFPAGVPNTSKQLEESSETLLESALSRYKAAMAIVNRARLSVAALQNSIAGVQMLIQREFASLIGLVGSVEALADMLINAPGNFSAMFRAQFARFGQSYTGSSTKPYNSVYSNSGSGSGSSGGAVGSGGAVSGAAVEADPLFMQTVAKLADTEPGFTSFVESRRDVTSKLEAARTLTAAAVADSVANSAAGGLATVAVVKAARELVRDMLLVHAVRTSAAMPVVLPPAALPAVPSLEQQVALPIVRPEVPAADEIIALRDAACEALWGAALAAPHEHFTQLESVRKQLQTHLTQVARSGVRLVQVTPKQSLPALVLAYQRFGDASRAQEIVTRNRVKHPGFLPPAVLQVAQE